MSESPWGSGRWTVFDHEDRSTWPPFGELVLVCEECHGYCIRFLDIMGGTPTWLDEHGSVDDGYTPGDLWQWHPLPPAPEASP
jgi:hypothetical protein